MNSPARRTKRGLRTREGTTTTVARSAPSDSPGPRLRRREREILTLLIAGQSVKEAAATLGLSRRTADTYLGRLKRRLGQRSLLALVVHLVKHGVDL